MAWTGQSHKPQRPRLAEPLFQEAAPRSAACGVKGALLFSLLVAVALAGLRASAPHTVPKAVTLAGQYMQPANLRKSTQPLRALQLTRPTLGWQSMQPAGAGALRQAANFWQPSPLSRALPIVKQATGEAVEEPSEKPSRVDPTEEFLGMVNHWNVNKGYGFIQMEDGNSIFCHIKHVKGGGAWHPSVTDKVKFNKVWEPRKDVYIADNVEMIAAGDHRGHRGDVDDEMLAAPMGELSGTVAHWNLQKGFGFIKPDIDDGLGGNSKEIFAHFSQLVGCSRLVPNDRVTYNKGFNEQSKEFEAKDIRFDRQEWNR